MQKKVFFVFLLSQHEMVSPSFFFILANFFHASALTIETFVRYGSTFFRSVDPSAVSVISFDFKEDLFYLQNYGN